MVTKIDLKNVATLARLQLKEEERKKYEKELLAILDYIEKLKELDISAIEPTTHVMQLANVFRPDIVQPSLDIEEVLKHAPERKGRFFRVPKVIE
jgi:aspartyl-tRNA(Asn)/glutamyl-tRNA(Gln) amidotransferase subunit C